MGMFDTFIAKVKCPTCGKIAMRNFQCKQFERFLDTYKIGDSVGKGEVISGHFHQVAYDLCQFCDNWIYVDVIIKNKKFTGIANPTTRKRYAD